MHRLADLSISKVSQFSVKCYLFAKFHNTIDQVIGSSQTNNLMKLKSKRVIAHRFKISLLTGILPTLWLALISWIAFFSNLGTTGLVDETEPLFAEAARQMLVTGDWITPYFNQVPRFDKPPLIYWLMASAYRMLGVNEWSVRLPSAIAAFTLTSFGFYVLQVYVQKLREKQKPVPGLLKSFRLHPLPWIGSALIALNPEIIAWGRIGVSDLLLTACMSCGLFSFFIGYIEQDSSSNYCLNFQGKTNSYWYITFYIFIALAVLSKGPVGLILPLLIISSFALYLGKTQELIRELNLVKGGIIFIAISLPWYILITLKNGHNYLESFFGYHNFQRFTQVVNNHAAPWYFYGIVVLIGFAPWSIHLPLSMLKTQFWKRQEWRVRSRVEHLSLFALIWLICVLTFFTISVTKLPSYILPSMPAAALLVSLFWSDLIEAQSQLNLDQKSFLCSKKIIAFSSLINSVFLFGIGLIIYRVGQGIGTDPEMPNFSQELLHSGLLEKAALIWIIAAILIILLRDSQKTSRIFMVNLIGFMAFLILAITPAYNLFDQHRQEPLRIIANTVLETRISQEELVMIGYQKPSLVFYTQNPIQYFQEIPEALAYFKTSAFQDSSTRSILIVTSATGLTKIGLQPQQYQELTQASPYQLVRISKSTLLSEVPEISPNSQSKKLTSN